MDINVLVQESMLSHISQVMANESNCRKTNKGHFLFLEHCCPLGYFGKAVKIGWKCEEKEGNICIELYSFARTGCIL